MWTLGTQDTAFFPSYFEFSRSARAERVFSIDDLFQPQSSLSPPTLTYFAVDTLHPTMAKSTRSKVKRHFRAKKRTEGVYAVAEAARLNRLHQKLKVITTLDKDGDVDVPEESFSGQEDAQQQPGGQTTSNAQAEGADAIAVDSGSAGPSTEGTKRISTHGPRGSRREEWRLSKGLPAHPQVKGTNRQGGIAAKRKAGRCHRRR
ncbi:hypothetical protein C8Q72DRAFT_358595 [Fomitopsis betulina]|nr:hypothetical protein C8Q72DRAFT_358595 [Fomitopsis betulina]